MGIPVQSEITDALLAELLAVGGSAKPRDLYDRVAARFPSMTPEERSEELDKWGTNKFNNKVQWSRQSLLMSGYLDGSVRGIWTLTDEGIAAAQALGSDDPLEPSTSQAEPAKLLDLIAHHSSGIREVLAERLQALDPFQFEELSGQLLRAMGFRDVVVTQKTADGGIDGHGKLRVGIVSVNAAFQSKRWKDTVHRPAIDQFRGATQGRFDQAILMTTARFSENAIAESIRPAVIPIILVDGPRMIELMIENEIGVNRKPLLIAQIDEGFFAELGEGLDS